jgi:DNA-binding IclR family transcriptional regulator
MRTRGKRPPEGEPVVDRAFALLAAFDAGHRLLTLRELSRRSGIPVSSTLRLAGRLLAWGALERDEEGRYSIGLRLLEVASLAPRGHGLRQVALPFMSDLAAVTKQHVQLAVREGLEVTLVERFSSHSAVPVLYRVGGKMPLHCTGMGLALLAFAPVEVQEEVLSLPLHGEPDHHLIPPAVMRRTLAEVRHERLAIYRRMDPDPLVAVAAPIFGEQEEAVAAIGVLLPERMAQPRRLGYALRTAAQSISRQLGAPSGLDARHAATPDGGPGAGLARLLLSRDRAYAVIPAGRGASRDGRCARAPRGRSGGYASRRRTRAVEDHAVAEDGPLAGGDGSVRHVRLRSCCSRRRLQGTRR